ncbi:butyrophilin subfamily 2 member A2-like [Chiroxiphia lanceolata]|uniref:butyrophilin subfamily 2 member A2-like n=1 Tax=Chiroxiphia lanceolata TaxID=296741 RepID=UPI0013CE45C4|nr:butyrophilin subfamily 2 member A2-like [Chiroxiphia lanceolata]
MASRTRAVTFPLCSALAQDDVPAEARPGRPRALGPGPRHGKERENGSFTCADSAMLSWDQGTPPRCQVTAKQLLLQPRVQERAQSLQAVVQGRVPVPAALSPSSAPAQGRCQRHGPARQHPNHAQQPLLCPSSAASANSHFSLLPTGALPAPLTVTAPPGPITVAKGEDVVLPCSFSPGQNAQDTEVTWFREQFLPFVHRYKLGQDQYGEQMVQYQGRTELGKDGLAKGSADLRIFHVQPSDTGNYTCFVRRGSDYDDALVELKVTASGSAPLIALERYEHGGIRVACRSAGWYPRPRVLWHDPHGRHLPSLSENATQDKNGLFAAESSIILTRAGNQELSCSVQHLPHTPGQGSALYVSDPFFQDAHPWRIALGVVLAAVVTLLIIAVCLFKIKVLVGGDEFLNYFHFFLSSQESTAGWGWDRALHCSALAQTRPPARAGGPRRGQTGDVQINGPQPICAALSSFSEQQAQELAWRRHAVPIEEGNVVLDPDTAHCELVLSDNGKRVTRADTRQNIPDTPERFNVCHCVLGCEGFTSGRHYWEVEVVEDAGRWAVGIFREDVRRKGYIELKPEKGIWAVGKQAVMKAFTSPSPTELFIIKAPRRIRVFLDYEMGQVAFFSVDEGIPIFTFPRVLFEGKIVHPWVSIGPETCLKIWP